MSASPRCPQHPQWPVMSGRSHCVQCAIHRGEYSIPEPEERSLKPVADTLSRNYRSDPPPPKPIRIRKPAKPKQPKLHPCMWSDCSEMVKRPSKLCRWHQILSYGIRAVEAHEARLLRKKRERNAKIKTLTVNGTTHTISEWASITGTSGDTIRKRLARGVSPALAVSPERLAS